MIDGLAGLTLADYLVEHERLPLGEGLAILNGLLEVVGAMHRDGVADGAINAARIVSAGPGKVALIPAAEAKQDPEADAYLSPQQRKGEPADPRADVYAIGVLAYRALMGVLPYSAGEDPLDPHAYLPNLTDRVRRTFTIAVQKNLTERFADALTFRAALRGDSDLALASPTLKWAVPEGIPEGDEGAAEEFAEAEPTLDDSHDGSGDEGGW